MRAIQRPGLAANPYFEAANHGKRELALDLRSSEGRTHLQRLVAEADVFLTNMRPDVRTRLGIDAETLHGLNPRLV